MIEMKNSDYTCASCKQTYQSVDKEYAEKEYLEWLKENPRMINDQREVVCDDCYKEFNEWYLSLTPMDKLIIEQDLIKE